MGVLRYVVLHHTGIERPHYDLMVEFESGSALLTWRLPHWPPQQNDEFTPLAKHRRDYLEYEGPVAGDRGSVKRIAAGDHRILESSPTRIIIGLGDGTRIELPLKTGRA
ncbi:MAG TPA: hypothetical protein VHX86_13095 [Tepidisphaeraceae bacterium]|jgi:hypothetical protein|nr:hypothetical protein [Tepidisphaeraceae bacterium]